MKIESLTREQSARMLQYRDKWIAIGLSTEPANRPEAEKGIILAYQLAGLKPPEKIVWCGSPFSQGITRAIVAKKDTEKKIGDSVRASVWDYVGASVGASVKASVADSVWDSVRASVWDSVADSVADSVWASVRDSVWDSVGASVWASVWVSVGASVAASVWASVGDSVWDSVWVSVGASVGASVRDSVRASVYGQHDAGWLSFHDFLSEVCGLEFETKKLTGLWLVAKNAGWFLPHEKICWISERPTVLRRNDDGRLHCESGMALAYPDGWGIYALNGIRMREEHIMTPAEKLNPGEILLEKNVEIRRELIRKIGIERFLQVCPHKMLHKSGNYELLSLSLSAEISDARFLKMVNPSIGCYHVEAVAPECNTVQQAINWRAGNINQEWTPEVLT